MSEINSAVNLGITDNADGYAIVGGKTNRRSLTLSGDNFSISLTGASSNEVLTYSGGVWTNLPIPGAPATNPGGVDTEVQFNDGGTAFAGATIYYDKLNRRVGINKVATVSLDITGKAGDTSIYTQIDGGTATERGIHIAESGTSKWSLYVAANESSANFYINSAAQNILRMTSTGNVGIDLSLASHTKLQIGGPIATALSVKTASYPLTASDSTVIMNSTSNLTATLPTAAGITGRIYIIKNINTGKVTITPDGAETIDGETFQEILQYDSINVQSDGTNWIVI